MLANLRERPWYLAVAIGVVAAVILAITSFAGDEDRGGPFAPIADAAEKTANVPGARMAIQGELEVPGQETILMSGQGAYNGKTDRSIISMEIEGGPPGADGTAIVQVSEGFVMYQRMPAFAGELPDGKEWIMIDLSEGVPDQSIGTGGSLKQQFQQLESVSSDAEDLGTERIRGVETRHYSATIDQHLALEQLREAGDDEAADQLETVIEATDSDETPLEVWIDARGFLRRMSMEIPFGGVVPGDATMRMTQDLYDFGVRPKVDLPAEEDVFDATELAQQQLEAASEQ